MRIEVDSGNLDGLEWELDRARDILEHGSSGGEDDLATRLRALVVQAEIILECAEDTSDWERKLPAHDGGEGRDE